MLFSSLSGGVLFAAGAAAHGAVTSYVIAGKEYPGQLLPSCRQPYILKSHRLINSNWL